MKIQGNCDIHMSRPVPRTRVPGTRPMNRVPGSVLPVLLPESEILF